MRRSLCAHVGSASSPKLELSDHMCRPGQWICTRARASAFRPPAAGSTAFTCGDANGGFIHVRDRHAAEWLTRCAAYGPTTGLDWSDIADFDIKSTLRAPLSASDAGDQKTCFGGLVQIREVPTGDILSKYKPSVSVSQNNRRIITAIPTTHERCSGIFG